MTCAGEHLPHTVTLREEADIASDPPNSLQEQTKKSGCSHRGVQIASVSDV